MRLGITPVLVAAYMVTVEAPLPFFAPVFTASVLALSRARPPLLLLIALCGVMFGITWILAVAFTAIASHPLSFWLILLAVASIAFARLGRNPQDMPATIVLSMGSFVTVLLHFPVSPASDLPWIIGRGIVTAAVASLLAHALLPSMPEPAEGAPPISTAPPTKGDAMRAVFKAIGLVVALMLFPLIDETNALLAAVTIGPVLAMPDRRTGWSFGWRSILGNLVAFLAAMPPLLLLLSRPEPFAALFAACAAGVVLAARAQARGAQSIPAIAIPTYSLVLALWASTAASGSDALLGERLLQRLGALMAGVAAGIAIHALLPIPERQR